jgi:N-succinyl-L-ornithine transcarbamylase
MQRFTSVHDVPDLTHLLKRAEMLRNDPWQLSALGRNLTLGLIFLNPSLRTRLSTQKAAQMLGMNVMIMNMDKEGWALELEDGAVMNGNTVEHIKDAAAVMGQYCDFIGLRAFPGLKNRDEDYGEYLMERFISYAKKPFISLESATRHPLQSFADLLTIRENWAQPNPPKVVLTWAPHVKALPQAVPNSFAEWMCRAGVDFCIAQPKGMELSEKFTEAASVYYNQHEALENADFVYVKNWSAFDNYGKPYQSGQDWLLSPEKLAHTRAAKIMHCLPVRRNVELSDALLDGPSSLVQAQAKNRVLAAQTVLAEMIIQNKG